MEHIPQVFWLIPIASVCALGMAWYFFKSMMKAEEGTPRMVEIAEYVRRGAMAYLKQQYKVVLIVFVVLAIVFAIMAYGFNAQNEWVPFAFLTGGFFSGLAGFFGMKTATYCQCENSKCSTQRTQQWTQDCLPFGSCHGTRCRWIRLVRHSPLVHCPHLVLF